MKRSVSRRHFLFSAASFATAIPTKALGNEEILPLSASGVCRAGDRYLNPRKVLLWECTRKEIREALETGRLKAAIVPTGSTEQHNEHLAMIHDTASAVLVSQLAALQLYPKVIVSTPVPVGISPHWMERKGTLTLRPETFLAMVFDICDSLKAHGIKTILIVNGHGGNDKPLKSYLPELRTKLGIQVEVCSYWESYFASESSKQEAKKLLQSGLENIPAHSAEFETSIGLAAFPERVRREGVDYEKVHLELKDPEDLKSDRNYYQDSLLATSEKGEALIRIAVDWLAERLRGMIGNS